MNYIDLTLQEGGSGVSNYDLLTNQPQINGVTLTGNKTNADLNIQDIRILPNDYTINVATDGSGDFTDIQSAIDSLNGKICGGTVTIQLKASDTFTVTTTVNLSINCNINQLIIQSDNSNKATLNTSAIRCFEVTNSSGFGNILLQSLVIVGTNQANSYGVRDNGHQNINVYQCEISKFYAGCVSENGGKIIIRNNTISNITLGVLNNSAHMIVLNNTISSATTGVHWLNSAITQAYSNTFTNVTNNYIATTNELSTRGVCLSN